jgi:preprotein translocase subunit Sec61beta
MRVRLKGKGLLPKEVAAIIIRFCNENNIKSIDNLSLYFNSKDSRQLDISPKKKDFDMEERAAEGFDSVSF